MINFVLLLLMLAAICYVGSKLLAVWIGDDSHGQLYWCACGCDKKFASGAPWDGYHGPGYGKPVVYDPTFLEERKPETKAIDYSPESVVGWEDIQWTVEKRLPKEQ